MKKLIYLILLLLSTVVYAADTKLTALGELTTVADGDWIYLVDITDTSSKKMTVLNLFDTIDTFAELNTITADKTLVNEEDAVTWDALGTFGLGLTITTGDPFTFGVNRIDNGSDLLDGEMIGADTIDDDSLDFADITGVDLTLTDCGAITSTGTITATVGFDIVGAADMDYGSGDVTDHTFTTDGTGTAEFVLPAGSIDGTEILDDTVDSAEYAATSIDYEHLADDVVSGAAAVGTFESGDTFLVLEAGVGLREADFDDLPGTQLTEEEVEDFVGGMLGGTETDISVTYQDASNDIDFVVTSLVDIVTTSPLTVNAGANLDDVIVGSDADITLAITVLKDLVTTSPVTGGTNDIFTGADADITVALDFTAAWDFGGAAGSEWVNDGAPTTDAAGEIALDTTITDHQPLWQYYDGGENMTVIAIDTAQLPAQDNEIVKYDAGSDKFVLEADASAGTTAYDDISDPDASGSISFDAAEAAVYTSSDDEWVGITISNTQADNAGDTELLTLAFTDDGDTNSHYLIMSDAAGTQQLEVIQSTADVQITTAGDLKFVAGGGDFNFADDSLTTTGDVEAATITLTGADANPAAAGEMLYDNSVSGMSGGALRWYDDNSVRMLVDLELDAATDEWIVVYDADADGFYMRADADTGGSTAWDDIGDPDAAATVDFVTYTQTIDIGKSDSGGGSGLILDVTDLGNGTDDVIALEITTTADEDSDYIPIAIYNDSGVGNELLFKIDARGGIILAKGAQIYQALISDNYIYISENSDDITLYFGGTDVDITWSDGALNLRNQEDGVDAIVEIEGYGAGEKGILRVLSDGDDKYIELYNDDTDAVITNSAGNIIINPVGLGIVVGDNGDEDYTLTFDGDTSDGVLNYDEDNADFEFDQDIASTGNVEGATITEGGNAVWNATETDIIDSIHYAGGSIDDEHVADDSLQEPALNTTNAAGAGTDNYVLSYNHAGTNFTWVTAGAGDMLKATYDSGVSGGVDVLTTVDSTYASDYVLLTGTAVGTAAPKTDGALTYDATSGTLAATEFSGGGANLTAVDAATGDSATAFFDAGTIEHEYGGLEADINAYTGLVAITGGATAEVDAKSELEGHIADVADFAEADGDTWTGTHDLSGATVTMPKRTANDDRFYLFNLFNPNSIYDTDTQVCFEPNLPAAITITEVTVSCDADPATELDIDLKWADAFIGLGNAALIEPIDTTNGTTDIDSGFDDATVAAGKCLYVEFGADPISAIKQAIVKVRYDYD